MILTFTLIAISIWFSIFVDARISYLMRGWTVPKWVENDLYYLILPVFLIGGLTLVGEVKNMFYFGGAGLILGSQIWDMIFGAMIYDDMFFPFRKWLFRMGFGGHRGQRILADILRVVVGSALFILGVIL